MHLSKSSQFIISNLIILFIISLYSLLFAGAPDTLWTRTFGGTEDDVAWSMTTNEDFVIVGSTKSFGAGFENL